MTTYVMYRQTAILFISKKSLHGNSYEINIFISIALIHHTLLGVSIRFNSLVLTLASMLMSKYVG